MFTKDSNMLKYAAIRQVMDRLENTVLIIFTQHFEASCVLKTQINFMS